MFRARSLSIIVLLLIASVYQIPGRAQTTALPHTTSPALIHERVDESKMVALTGNTRLEASAENDAGLVSDDLALDHMMLQLKRSPEQEHAVEQLITELHDPQSPKFHKWLTAAEFGREYGGAESDLRAITGWLEAKGFTVNSVYPNGMVVDFSGNAGLVRRAFQTSIHNLNVNGVHHISNFSNPMIPAALAPAVSGIVSIHDFRPHKMSRAANTAKRPAYTLGGGAPPAVVPADLATIYDLNPLFSQGITGAGQTIAVLEDTDLYTAQDWTTFRKTFGLSQLAPSGSLTTVHPSPASGTNNCSDPGVNTDDDEAILDAEWASAAAPGATIEVASCSDSATTSGLYVAGQNLVNSTNPPAIVSISYGECEAENTASMNLSFNLLFQQAVAEGMSIFVSSGDEGAAGCDVGSFPGSAASSASHGIAVSAYASTPYNVAVGGTDFADVLNGNTNSYWSNTNSATYGSARSYIPEIPWNDSCAGSLYAGYLGYSTGYGANGFCNSITSPNGVNSADAPYNLVVVAGSGGPSNCATGVPSIFGVASGTCQGWAKPSWQSGVSGIASDGVRDIPDVSLFASDGANWGHFSIICFSDPSNGGTPCTGAPNPYGTNGGNSTWSGIGGTSIASPEMAGIQALVNQSVGARQGNPNFVYYALALSNPSVFHPVTQGDIDVDCAGIENCFGFIGNVDYGRNGRIFATTAGGALSVSTTSFVSAYPADSSTWNFANGLGSVDAYKLVTNWIKQ